MYGDILRLSIHYTGSGKRIGDIKRERKENPGRASYLSKERINKKKLTQSTPETGGPLPARLRLNGRHSGG